MSMKKLLRLLGLQQRCRHRNKRLRFASIRGHHYECNCGAEIVVNHMTGVTSVTYLEGKKV